MTGTCPLCGKGPCANLGQHFRWHHGQSLKVYLAAHAPRCQTCGGPIGHPRICAADYVLRRKFCSQRCHGIASDGAKHPNYRGGWIDRTTGYRRTSVGRRRRGMHRLVVEAALGRRLDRGEHVHHKNGDKLDNRLENLQVMSASEHMRLHHSRKH